jgi:hypothetical protein
VQTTLEWAKKSSPRAIQKAAVLIKFEGVLGRKVKRKRRISNTARALAAI